MTEQIELFAIDSPCIGVCQSNKKGYCFGCLRSRKERQLWFEMSDEERRKIIKLLVARKGRLENMRRRQREQMSFDFEETMEMGQLFDL